MASTPPVSNDILPPSRKLPDAPSTPSSASASAFTSATPENNKTQQNPQLSNRSRSSSFRSLKNMMGGNKNKGTKKDKEQISSKNRGKEVPPLPARKIDSNTTTTKPTQSKDGRSTNNRRQSSTEAGKENTTPVVSTPLAVSKTSTPVKDRGIPGNPGSTGDDTGAGAVPLSLPSTMTSPATSTRSKSIIDLGSVSNLMEKNPVQESTSTKTNVFPSSVGAGVTSSPLRPRDERTSPTLVSNRSINGNFDNPDKPSRTMSFSHKARRRISSILRPKTSSPGSPHIPTTSTEPHSRSVSASPSPSIRGGINGITTTTATATAPEGSPSVMDADLQEKERENSTRFSSSTKPPRAPSSGLNTPTKVRTAEVINGGGGLVSSGLASASTSGDLAAPLPMFTSENTAVISSQSENILTTPTPLRAFETSQVNTAGADKNATTNFERDATSADLFQSIRESTPSVWSYDFENAGDDSDSEGEEYYTPTDGLSEIGEEDEEEHEHGHAHTHAHAQGQNGLAEQMQGLRVSSMATSITGVDDKKSGGMVSPNEDAVRQFNHDDDGIVRRAQVDTSPSVLATHILNHGKSRGGGVSVPTPIDQTAFLDKDIAVCSDIVALFLTSHMKEAENRIYESDPKAQHMYIQNAGAVVQAIKGMMTFDHDDLQVALEIAKGTSALADSLRKPSGGIGSKLIGFVKSNAVANIKSMTVVQKHAELVYAESLLIKAVLGIVAGGSWVGLIHEALNMRSAYGIYRTLQQYLEVEGDDPELDEHFKSGVDLGTGLSSLMLSLLPGRVLKLAEVFGYVGDRKAALKTLMAAGGWSEDSPEPGISAEQDGVRRPICDMALLTFHLVISVLIPVSGVNIPLAKKILDFNLKRFPDGLFFLYFQSRLYTTQGQPEKANATLQSALDLKLEYIQLQHICLFDMAVNNLMMTNFKRSKNCFEILAAESSWSKATYLYSEAACLAEMAADDEGFAEQAKLDAIMADVPKSMRRLAGKSLPIEKFVSRKARKFMEQNHRLMLPAVEIGYFFGALPNAPPRLLYSRVVPTIRKRLDALNQSSPEAYNGGLGYWDDYCLANFLLGVSLSFAAYPHSEAVITDADRKTYPMSVEAAAAESKIAFGKILQDGHKITLDHWIIYFTHYELARLQSQSGNNIECKTNLEAVMSGKPLLANHAHVKPHGKYSMESALMLKTHAALQTLKESPTEKMH